jgi:acetyl-CoA carboxylase carboxyl transferase subunit alpha
VVPEPLGGAHRDPGTAIRALGASMEAALRPLLGLDGEKLREQRREKFLAMGTRAI